MKRTAIPLMFVAALLLFIQQDLLARGPGGGGRGGGGRGGGGFSGGGGMSRPSPSAGRSPALGGPSAGARPSAGTSRPSVGAAGVGRPGAGGGGVGRPGPGAGGVGRPGSGAGAGTAVGGRPSASQLSNFLDIPRPSTGAVVGGGGVRPGAGGAAADFLQLGAGRPTQLPAGPGSGQGPVAGAPGVGAPGVGGPGVGGPGVGGPGVGGPGVGGPGVGGPGVGGPGVGGPGVGGPGVGPGPAGGERRNLADHRANRVENRQQLQGDRQQRRDEVRGQVAENHPRLDFWSDYPGWAAWRISRPYRWATWAAITGWVGYGWSEPNYYSYGDNVYYEGDQVYYGDQPVATADEYAQQAETIAAGAPDANPANGEWLPLGVFAVTQDGQASGAEPTLFMQLAISKEGIVAGTLKNTATGEVQTLEGMADKKSQRAAWGVAGRQRPIAETGISNLTEDTAPVLIHFADGQTQQWLLVRLEEPKQG